MLSFNGFLKKLLMKEWQENFLEMHSYKSAVLDKISNNNINKVWR